MAFDSVSEEPRQPNAVDLHVGHRIRLRRKLIGMSQERLADALGLTFQQVQKYERGANRVSASKLWDIARRLDVPITYFFDGLDAEAPSAAQQDFAAYPLQALSAATGGLQLADAFVRIPQHQRRALVGLACAMAEGDQPETPAA